MNRLWAHPLHMTCILGALGLNVLVFTGMPEVVTLAVIFADVRMLLLALTGALAMGGVGAILAMMLVWPVIRKVCCRLNGAPFKPGDEVRVLTGTHQGQTARVIEVTQGQGGWDLLELDLERTKADSNPTLFNEYQLLKLRCEDALTNLEPSARESSLRSGGNQKPTGDESQVGLRRMKRRLIRI